MICTPRRQRGATLLISLIMLVVLTLFAVTGFNLSSVNLKIAGNFQQQRFIEASVMQAIEQVVSDQVLFYSPLGQTIVVNGISVTVAAAGCYHNPVTDGYESNVDSVTGEPTGPQDTVWEVRGSGTDPLTGAQAVVTQGVQIIMRAGNCQYPT